MAIRKKSFAGLVVLSLALHLSLSLSFGQEKADPSAFGPQLPLSGALNPDGTLKLGGGVQGGLDPKGFHMVSGPQRQPRFIRAGSGPQTSEGAMLAAASDADWDGQFASFFTDNTVYAIAVSGADVYVGGNFTTVGGDSHHYIAKWNGTNWSNVGSSTPNGRVLAIAISGTDVYVGGEFTTPGNRIAKWNGASWSALGTGVSGPSAYVRTITVSGTDVYVGGSFTSAGGNSAMNVAKWNGVAWSALSSGVNGRVDAIAVSGTVDIYVGGQFSTAGGNPANCIAKWNGASWSALGSGVSGPSPYVRAIAVSGTDVYVGGDFTAAGGSPANYVAKWDEASWSALGSGLDGLAMAIAVSGTDVYVNGNFTEAGGSAAGHSAIWNGTTWSALGSGLDDNVYTVAVGGTNVFVGGDFHTAGGAPANHVAKWNTGTATWDAKGSAVTGQVRAIAVNGTDVYVGGDFDEAGGEVVNHIAKWDGMSWTALGSGVDSLVYAIAVSGTDVYVGGVFDTAGGTTVNHIAKWDGVNWSAMGSGVGGWGVQAIAVSGTDVYVGGVFDTAGGTPTENIAKWDGAAWSAMGSGVTGSVYAIAANGTDVYVGGSFVSPQLRIAKWNGSSWSGLGSGVNNTPYAIAVSGTDVYVGGHFNMAGGSPVNYIAKWSGASWSSLGVGANSGVSAISVSGTDLYVGGEFTIAGGVPASHIAQYRPGTNTWSALGSGLDGDAYAAAAGGTNVYVGGAFSEAGLKTSNYFGRWIAPLTVTSPNGGEVWEADSLQTITWSGSADAVKIEYSTDNGATWTTLIESMDNTGSLNGAVPNAPSTQCLVRISDTADVGRTDTSDGTFTISGFVVTSPNGGEQWAEGSAQTITWTTVGSYPTVSLLFSPNGGANWSYAWPGGAETANTGSFPWTVPYNPQTQCLVRVCEPSDLSPSDTSDTVFSIVPYVAPTITVTSPNGGENWMAGSTHDVTWTQTGLTGSVTIDLYKGSVLHRNLGTAEATAGTFEWAILISETAGTDYRILVWQEGTVSDDSNADFAIVSASPTRKVDFNKDGQEDLLWRSYGSDAYQGWNLVWFMAQSGGLSPAAPGIRQNQLGGTNLLNASIPSGVNLNPMDIGDLRGAVPAVFSETPLEIGARQFLRPKKVMRNPAATGRNPTPRGKGRAIDRILEGRPLLEVAAASNPASSGSMEIASLDQTGQVALNLILDTAWEIAGAGDFDGNGTTDILWRYYGSGTYQGWNVIWYMDGTTVIGQGLPNVVYDTNWRIDGTGDFNGDGKADILWRSYSTDAYQGWNIVWYMNGAEILGQGFPNAITDTEWKVDGVGDFDGNGSTDILWRNYGSGEYQGWNIIWYMDGMTVTGQGFPNRITDTNWRADGTGDFDNDGKSDIIWRCYSTDFYQGWNIIWYMNGAEIKSQEIMKSITDTNWRIANR